MPTGCGDAPVRPASSTGPHLEPKARGQCVNGVSAPVVSPARAPTGLLRGQYSRAASADGKSHNGTPSGIITFQVQNSTELSTVSEHRVPGRCKRYGCHRNTADRAREARLTALERQRLLAGKVNAFKEAMQEVQSYPIEARPRQKARAKYGHIPKKNPQVAEQQFDDCGEDFAGLGPLLITYEQDKNDADDQYFFINLSHYVRLTGCRFDAENPRYMLIGNIINNMVFDSFEELLAWGRSAARSPPSPDMHPSVDVAQLCGGAADVAYMLVRRGFAHGLNFVITVGFNLRIPNHKKQMWQCLDSRQPTIVLISTPCTGMKGFKALNCALRHQSYHTSRNLSVLLGRLGGEVAYGKCSRKWHFVSEHPRDSDLYKQKERQQLAQDSIISWCYADQCMARSARNVGKIEQDVRVNKPSEFWASDERPIEHLRPLVCDGNPVHADIACRVVLSITPNLNANHVGQSTSVDASLVDANQCCEQLTAL